VHVRVETTATPFTAELQPGAVLEVPVKHGEGRFVADGETLRRLDDEGRVVFRYCSPEGDLGEEWNPNGSAGHIAGVRGERGNVVGLMPHPEHAVDPDLGPTGGRALFESLLDSLLARV
jgi:phosphoribosylformylglycinamidine (FGAM) synthase-like amidotransferase family enzyme